MELIKIKASDLNLESFSIDSVLVSPGEVVLVNSPIFVLKSKINDATENFYTHVAGKIVNVCNAGDTFTDTDAYVLTIDTTPEVKIEESVAAKKKRGGARPGAGRKAEGAKPNLGEYKLDEIIQQHSNTSSIEEELLKENAASVKNETHLLKPGDKGYDPTGEVELMYFIQETMIPAASLFVLEKFIAKDETEKKVYAAIKLDSLGYSKTQKESLEKNGQAAHTANKIFGSIPPYIAYVAKSMTMTILNIKNAVAEEMEKQKNVK